MKHTGYFLWPEGSIKHAVTGVLQRSEVSTAERLLTELFPSGYPVLCSSARAAIAMVLEHCGASRPELVAVFPYASHCVLDAISRQATPQTYSREHLRIAIEYHQWGYVQTRRTTTPILIEDAVDTLCVPGEPLFPLAGSYEIWSLPKILGTTSGGVIWCRDESDAEEIRDLRARN